MGLTFSVLDAEFHDRKGFSCGVAALDDYLRTRAGQHQRSGIATTHVLIDEAHPAQIIGYCTLAAAQLHLHELQAADRKRLPAYPVPAVRVGRLAVAQTEMGKGYGRLLLGHAVNLALSVQQTLGVRAIVVDAKDLRAAAFYEAFGFRPTTTGALTFYLPLGRT